MRRGVRFDLKNTTVAQEIKQMTPQSLVDY